MIHGPLAIAIECDGVLNPVTKYASGLGYRKTAPGGMAGLTVDLALPADMSIPPISYVMVTSTTTAKIVWDGYIEWPTPVDDNGVRHYSLAALGGQSLFNDTRRPVWYCDYVEMMNQESWIRQPLTAPGATADVAAPPTAADTTTAPDAVVIQFPEGMTLQPEKRIAMEYRLPREAGRSIYRLGMTRVCGNNDSAVEAQVVTWGDGSFTKNAHLSDAQSTTPVTRNAWVGNGTLAASQQIIRLQLQHISVGVVAAGENHWAAWYWMHATALLGRLNGSPRAFADYPNPGDRPALRTDMIVEDLLTRYLGDKVDTATAVVEQGSYLIDQFTMMDGARDADVLDALSLWEPDFVWEVGARQPNGKHSFAYRAWPSTARYVIPSWARFDEAGPDITLCNRIAVKWRTVTGADQTTIVTANVPELGDRVRDADPIDLPDGFGSTTNAQRVGAQALAAANTAATSGVITVTGQIFDRQLGRWADQSEIEAGYLAWLSVQGEAVRINDAEYDDEARSATLRVGYESPGLERFTGVLRRNGRDDWRRKVPARRKKKRLRLVSGSKKKGRR